METSCLAARIVQAAKAAFRGAFKAYVFLMRWLGTAFIIVWEVLVLAIGVHVIYRTAVGKAALRGPSGEPATTGIYVLTVAVWIFLLASGVLLLLVWRRIADWMDGRRSSLFGEASDGRGPGDAE